MELVRQSRGQAPGRAAGRCDGTADARPAPRRGAIHGTRWSSGDRIGVVPEVEVWGFSRTLGRLGEAALVAMEAIIPSACILPDVYHLHRGGSGLGGVKLLSPRAIHVFHFNDYPAEPPREKLTDADRVYPGDGVAPLEALLRDLAEGGFQVMLSLELFNRQYWSRIR